LLGNPISVSLLPSRHQNLVWVSSSGSIEETFLGRRRVSTPSRGKDAGERGRLYVVGGKRGVD